jgi:hypothetical protein
MGIWFTPFAAFSNCFFRNKGMDPFCTGIYSCKVNHSPNEKLGNANLLIMTTHIM